MDSASGQTDGAAEEDGAGSSQETVSHNDVIARAEQRKEASDIVKAAVREESERLKEIPAWENDSGSQIDPRNRVGEEATKIMDEKSQTDKEVIDQIGASQEVEEDVEPKMGVHEDSNQDRQRKERLESRIMIQQDIERQKRDAQQQPKSAKYDSIDPLAAREGEYCKLLDCFVQKLQNVRLGAMTSDGALTSDVPVGKTCLPSLCQCLSDESLYPLGSFI